MTPVTRKRTSPFLDPPSRTTANSLAVVHLSRDDLLPAILQRPAGEHDGYAEGAVINTRYGSFPHSTLLNVPWGSQIRASMVDTGSRGRKRKRVTNDEGAPDAAAAAGNGNTAGNAAGSSGGVKKAVAAASGFVHVLPPTPENWTMGLPHRTQVVYTPDYSYILHRIRARPGTVLLEAGAGSGSFTHASARAVYNGYPTEDKPVRGKVFSFEFHQTRHDQMQKELADHGLEDIVRLTHRDVYKGGFLVEGKSPEADAVFLDLPAPWEALPHLCRQRPPPEAKGPKQKEGKVDITEKTRQEVEEGEEDHAGKTSSSEEQRRTAEGSCESQRASPLNPKKTVHICTFSPCIEQVTRTVSTMRRLGWVDIEMVEIAHRRIHTARDRVGLNFPANERSVNISPCDVEEAVARLTEIEDKAREHAANVKKAAMTTSPPRDGDGDVDMTVDGGGRPASGSDGAAAAHPGKTPGDILDPDVGTLVTRAEAEIRTHTSYLVFAVLPREWSAEDEAAAAARWPCGPGQAGGRVIGNVDKATRKKERREQFMARAGSRNKRRRERDIAIAKAL